MQVVKLHGVSLLLPVSNVSNNAGLTMDNDGLDNEDILR